MKRFIFILFFPLALQAQHILIPQSRVRIIDINLSLQAGVGFITNASWNVTGNFELQRAFYSDYSDAVTIYSGTATSYIDAESVFTGICYYRLRKDGLAWHNASITKSIYDGTVDTRPSINGNSITQGQGADVASNGYAKIFYKVKGWTPPATGDIIGLPGNSITPQASPPTSLWVYNSPPNLQAPKIKERNYCINAFGINDCASTPILSNATPTDYRLALEGWIDYCVSVGWPLNRIAILGPFYGPPSNLTRLQTFRDAARLAASNKGVGFLSSMDFQIQVGMVVGTDGVHPNTVQHKQISYWLANYFDNTGQAPISPSITSITVESPTTILVKFNALYITATNTGWSFKKNGSTNNPTAISGTGTNILRFTVPTIAAGDIVTYSYDQSTGDTSSEMKIYSLELANATDQPVTNNIPSSYDSDATTLFNAITGTGESLNDDEKTSYSNLIAGLKTDGLWTKIKAFYVLGGSLNKSKWNFKDPRDLDAAFRLVQEGTVTFTSDGATGGSTSPNLLNTKYNPASFSVRDNFSLFFSQLGTSSTGAKPAMGSHASTGTGFYALFPCNNPDFSAVFNGPPGFVLNNNPVANGRYLVSRISSSGWTCYKNGIALYSPTNTSVAPTSQEITICGSYLGSDNKQSCAGIFDGFSSSEAALFESRVKTLEYILNRI